jgi:hypothetical protein
MGNKGIIETIINRVSGELTKDMSEDDSKEVLGEYRGFLELTLDKMPEEDKEWFQDFEIKNIEALDATKRLERIREERAGLEINVFERKAWKLAMEYSQNGAAENVTKFKEQAEELKQNIENFANQLKKEDSDLTKRFARIISEALLDCEYVMRDKQVASLRMGRILRQQSMQ